MKVAFVLIVHPPHDERIWYQEAESLRKDGNEIFIISSYVENSDLPNTYTFDGNELSKKEIIQKINFYLKDVHPEIIICDNPIGILAAKAYKQEGRKRVKIIYDITEWYPSKKNLRELSPISKIIKAIILILLSYYTSWSVNRFIFGESDKAKPFRLFFPWKKYIYLPYYSDPNQVKFYPIRNISKECTFLYAGSLTKEKGFDNVMKVMEQCAETYKDVSFTLHIITSDKMQPETKNENLKIQKTPFLPFLSFCEEIGKADFFLDLRIVDMENTRCLPIKLFYYMAAGRPVIYSNLKAIQQEVPEINQIGILVNPSDSKTIIYQIGRYLRNMDYYKTQCYKARELAEDKYNWLKIENTFIQFILDGGKRGK